MINIINSFLLVIKVTLNYVIQYYFIGQIIGIYFITNWILKFEVEIKLLYILSTWICMLLLSLNYNIFVKKNFS